MQSYSAESDGVKKRMSSEGCIPPNPSKSTYAQLSYLSKSESVQSYPGREDRGERAGERASLPGQEVGGGLLLCHRRKRVRVRVQAASQLRFTPNCANIFILSLFLPVPSSPLARSLMTLPLQKTVAAAPAL